MKYICSLCPINIRDIPVFLRVLTHVGQHDGQVRGKQVYDDTQVRLSDDRQVHDDKQVFDGRLVADGGRT